MKKLYIGLVLGLLLMHQAVAGMKTDREQEALKGPVRSIRTEFVDYSNKSGQWVEGHKFVQTEGYDQKGNLIERVHYNSDGSIKLKQEWINTYDIQGRIREKSIPSGGGITYKYSSKRDAVEEVNRIADGSISNRVVYIYDENGNISEQFYYTTFGKAYDSRYVFKYELNGKMIKVDYYSGGELTRTTTKSYDDKGNETMITFKKDGTILTKMLTTYEANGNISEIFYDKPDLLKGKTTYTYEYDPVGNWIQKKEIHEGKVETLEVTHRTITYYPDDKTP